MKTIIRTGFLSIFFLIACRTQAQDYTWSPDSIQRSSRNYPMDRYHDILRYHDPVMYLAFPIITPIVDRKIPLVDGEGEDGFWLEGQFGYRFVISQGKYFSYPLIQRLRFTFDVGLMPRMARDDSSPLLPSNNKFGLGFDFLLSNLSQLKKENANLLWATVQFHHYSNGQADSFFIDNPIKRNNYRGGDFSTNYYRVFLTAARNNEEKGIISASVGYQKDLNISGPLARSKELTSYYGDNRLLGSIQLTKRSKLVSVHYQNRATPGLDSVRLLKRRQLILRTEFEYIMGGLAKWEGENKRRFAWHNYFTYMPSVTNEVGFMIHTYLGRDYLNIRFDDVVFIGELGICVKFNAR
ncbi:MAG TPA: hypothetical protein VKA49_04365 [Flavitalea sp.]|nr:hypothetical protein [Flavitalea sp.]